MNGTQKKGGHPENLFQQAREKAGYTQLTASEALPLVLRTLQLYEAGTSVPPFDIVCRMADLYHCTTDDFRPENGKTT